MRSWAGLDGCGKSRPHRDSIPVPSIYPSPYPKSRYVYVLKQAYRKLHPVSMLHEELPAFAESFVTSSLPGCSFVDYLLCGNSVVDNVCFSTRSGLSDSQFVFHGRKFFRRSGYTNNWNSKIRSAEIHTLVIKILSIIQRLVFRVQCLERKLWDHFLK